MALVDGARLVSIVVSVVPCHIMCALGLCAYRVLGRSSCEKPLQGAEATEYGPERPFRRRAREGGMATAQDLREAILEGAAQRVRPVMMTVAAIIGGVIADHVDDRHGR